MARSLLETDDGYGLVAYAGPGLVPNIQIDAFLSVKMDSPTGKVRRVHWTKVIW